MSVLRELATLLKKKENNKITVAKTVWEMQILD
jgi:hypothetical protein